MSKSFKCDICERTLKAPYQNLKNHLKNIHQIDFHCKNCSKSFSTRKSGLDKHNLRMNHRLNAFECEKCCKEYASSASLRNHKSVCLDENKRRKVICDKCEKPLQSGLSFYNHKKTCGKTKSGTCDFCEREFDSQRAMSTHLTKVHKCQNCDQIVQSLASHKCNHESEDMKGEFDHELETFQNVLELIKGEFEDIPEDFESKLWTKLLQSKIAPKK